MLRRLRHDEGGFLMVTAIAMLVVTLGLGLALLAVVDTQTQAAPHEQRVDASFNAAESIANASVATLGQSWLRTAAQTPAGSTPPSGVTCGSPEQAYGVASDGTSASRHTAFGDALRSYVSGALSTDAGAWSVSICRGSATGDSTWTGGTSGTGSRPAYASSAAPDKDELWVRATTTLGGVRTSVAVKAHGSTTGVPLPTDSAVVVGAFNAGADDLTSVSQDLLGGLLGSSSGKLINPDADPQLTPADKAYIGVRCGLLTQLNQGNLCLTGTIAGATSLIDALGLGVVDDALHLNRFKQSPTSQVLTDTQIDALAQVAQTSGNVYRSAGTVNDGDDCLPVGTTSNTIVYIEQVGSDGNGTCKISGSRQAAALVVAKGNVSIVGPGQLISSASTFKGVIYALNRQHAAPQNAVVSITKYGKVTGAVFIDGTGQLRITVPKCTGLLCLVGGLLNGLLNANKDYSAVQHDVASVVTASRAATLYTSAVSEGGTFSHLR